jgi:spermidine synthase
MEDLARQIGDGPAVALRLGASLVPVGLCYACCRRPLRFGLGAAALLAAGVLCYDPQGLIQFRERSFFGQVTVQYDATREHRWLVHGTTLHGQQSLDPKRRDEPLTYYYRNGPIGQLFDAFSGPDAPRRVGVMGLGTGTLVNYGQAGQAWTFYEIDPAVVRIAQDERYFTFLSDSRARGVDLRVVLGDARLQLAHAPAGAYDLLVLDVFSSDSVPVHLLSYEAVSLYASKLTEDGVLLFNISNRYLDLEPVLARLAQEMGWTGYAQSDDEVKDCPGKTESKWAVLARRPQTLQKLVGNGRWQPLRGRASVGLWTDDFSNLLGVFLWKR